MRAAMWSSWWRMVFGVARRSCPDAADALGPGEEVVGGEAEVHPGLVVDDVVEGKVRESAGFGVSDDVLGTCSLSLAEFEGGDVGAGLVGDERGVPESFDGAERGVSFPRWPVTLVTRPGWPRVCMVCRTSWNSSNRRR